MLRYRRLNLDYDPDETWWTDLDDDNELVCFDAENRIIKGFNSTIRRYCKGLR